MLKKTSIVLLAFLAKIHAAQALPIVDHDAFSHNDKKAVLEVDSGLVWMDFGVNHHFTFNEVVSKLDDQYSEWRLPTQAEVIHLWDNLFAGKEGWIKSPAGSDYSVEDSAQIDYINQIASIFIQYSSFTNYLEGRYLTDTGLTTGLICDFVVDVDTGIFGPDDLPIYEISTLLVKKAKVNLPETPILFLFFSGLATLIIARHKNYRVNNNAA